MFTGLVESIGEVIERQPQEAGVRLTLTDELVAADCHIGDSVCVNGCCLTVVECGSHRFSVEAGLETLARTNLEALSLGDHVNLEGSLCLGGRLGGHFVTGHIDCRGHVSRRENQGDWSDLWVKIPLPWIRHLAPKGSVAVDGVSLTVVEVVGQEFSVALIPHTLKNTTLGQHQPGDSVNIETDILAKYVERALSAAAAPPHDRPLSRS